MEKSLEKLLVVVEKIQETLDCGSVSDKNFSAKIQSYCIDLKGTDAYINSNASKISNRSKKCLYSVDMMSDINVLLSSIRSQVNYLQSQK